MRSGWSVIDPLDVALPRVLFCLVGWFYLLVLFCFLFGKIKKF